MKELTWKGKTYDECDQSDIDEAIEWIKALKVSDIGTEQYEKTVKEFSVPFLLKIIERLDKRIDEILECL